MRRLIGLLFVGTLAAGLGTGMGAAAQATTNKTAAIQSVSPVTGGIYEIYLPGMTPNTLCADVTNGSHSTGTLLQVYHCHGSDRNGAPQLWSFTFAGQAPNNEVYYQIVNQNSGLCMRLADDSGSGGTRVMQDICNGFPDEIWQFHPRAVADGFQLINQQFPGECLAAANHSDSNGTPLVVHDCVDINSFASEVSLQLFNLG